jgi:hypothetical protein
MTPDQVGKLRHHLPAKLFEVEPSIESGASLHVQPTIDGQPTAGFPISVEGYSWKQIDSELRAMCQDGLISSGDAPYDGAAVGIFFANLTPAGREILGR